MSYCGKVIIFLVLCLALAGCSSGARHHGPDFTLESGQTAFLPESPGVTPPGSNALPPMVSVPSAPTNLLPKPAPQPFETWVSLEHWSKLNGFGAPKRIPGETPPVYSVATTNGVLMLQVGNQNARWNGLGCYLGFAPQIIRGNPFIHSLDIRKNFEPLICPSGVVKSNPIIVLDPGHGGSDTGAQSVFNGHYEKEYTLDLARRLQTLLATNGWTVLLTRTNDYFIALSNRVAFADQHKADLFLSLHFNSAAPNREPAGLETYCLTPAGMPSNLPRGYRDNPTLAYPNNNFDFQNLQFAFLLHRSLLNINGHLDRGIRRARFLGVLQGQNRPAALVEGGYLSNPTEARQIADPPYRQKMAEALAQALLENAQPSVNLASHSPSGSISVIEGKSN